MLNNAAEKRPCDEDEDDQENQSGNPYNSDGTEEQVRSLIFAI